MPQTGSFRHIGSGIQCFRELVHLATCLAYILVIPQYRVLPQLCTELQQKEISAVGAEGLQGPWNEAPSPGQLALLCQTQVGIPNAPHKDTQHGLFAAAAHMKALVTQVWLQVMVLGDMSVAALLTVALIHISTALLAWHSPPHPAPTSLSAWHERQVCKLAIRFLVVIGHVVGGLVPGTTRYHVLEVLLRDGQRLQMFAAFGWLDGWLLPVPLAWQVPLGLLEYMAFTAACSWYDARAGRPAASWQQHLLEFVVAAVMPILHECYHAWRAGPGTAAETRADNKGTAGAGSSSSNYSTRCSTSTRAANSDMSCAAESAGLHQQQHDPFAAQGPAVVNAGTAPGRVGVPATVAAGLPTGTSCTVSAVPFSYTTVARLVAVAVKVTNADFAADASACIAAVEQGLVHSGQQQATLLGNIVAVPGCVLLLSQMVVPAELQHPGGDGQPPSSRNHSSCLLALDGSAWVVQLPLLSADILGMVDGTAGTQGHSIGVRYASMQQLQQEAQAGRLLDTVLAAVNSSPPASCDAAPDAAVPVPGPEPAGVVPAGAAAFFRPPSGAAAVRAPALTQAATAAPCCQQGFCAVGAWGQPVTLQLQLPAGSMTLDKPGSHSSNAAYDRVRVVLSGGSGVLLDQVLPLTRVQVAADGSARVQLQLQPPRCTSSLPAAAFHIVLMPQASAAVARQLPMTQVTLLMLEQPVAAELVTWVTRHQLPVCQLSGMVGELAWMLDTQQQLQSVWAYRQAAAAGNRSPSDADTAAAAALARVHLAVTAADHLGPYLSGSGLPLAADLVAGVKQQVLVGAARLQPPAAGRVGLEQLGAEGSTSVQRQPQLDASIATVPAVGADAGTADSSSSPSAWQVQLLAVSSSTCSSQPTSSGFGPRSRSLQQQPALAAASKDCSGSSSAGVKAPGGAASSSNTSASSVPDAHSLPSKGDAAVGGAAEPAAADQLPVTPEERQAVVRGGWQGALLCWRGFSCLDTERAYLLFKADHLWVWDWVMRIYLVVVSAQVIFRYLKLAGHGLWPPHRVFALNYLVDDLSRTLLMLLARPWWRRVRTTWMLLHAMRTAVHLAWEAYMWPRELLTAVQGGGNKLLLFMPINLLMALDVPRAMVWTWFCFNAQFVWLSVSRAGADDGGLASWVYQWKCAGGTPLLLYCLGFTIVSFTMMACVSVVTDLWGRQAFLKTSSRRRTASSWLDAQLKAASRGHGSRTASHL